jgi:hypothetical protein
LLRFTIKTAAEDCTKRDHCCTIWSEPYANSPPKPIPKIASQFAKAFKPYLIGSSMNASSQRRNRQQILFDKARHQAHALAATIRELTALSNPVQIAELLRELQDEVTAS